MKKRRLVLLPLLLTSACFVNGCMNGAATSQPPSAANHFSVSAPANTTAGVAFQFTVTALTTSNDVAASYSGTVHFTSTDARAVLPANSSLINGTGTFSATFMTTGSQSITATDTATSSISGTAASIAVSNNPQATHFSVSAPANTTTGSAFNFTVTALDASNSTVTSYSGTVHFTSTDAQAVLPAASTLTNGTGTFSATLKTSGIQTITATDTVAASVTGTSNAISATALAIHFSVTVPSNATTGIAFSFSVIALDASNNAAPSYSGTIHFSSTDGQATLPANSPFSNGSASFSATLKTLGGQTITATDTGAASITGTSSSISVGTAAPTHLSVSAPGGVGPGIPFNLTATALDAANNVAPSYSGTVHFKSTDAQASLPANSTLTNGTASFSATLNTLGSQTITATDTANASFTGTSNSINVQKLAITSGPPPNGTVGVGYGTPHCLREGFALTTNTGSSFESWSGASLPPGLQIAKFVCPPGPFRFSFSTVWLLYGQPIQAGTFTNIVITANDPFHGTASASYTITISVAQASSASAKLADDASSALHHHYKLIDLGTLGGTSSYLNPGSGQNFGNFSSVLNNHGAITGFADTSLPDPFPAFCFGLDGSCLVTHAFQAQKTGALKDLSALLDGVSSASTWISPNGLVAGLSQNGKTDPLLSGFPENRAVLWQNGEIIDLGTLPEPEGGFESFASAVNSKGQVVGSAANTIPDENSMSGNTFWLPPLGVQTRAFLWDKQNGMRDLGTLHGSTDAQALLINERGQVVGLSYVGSAPTPSCNAGLSLVTGSFIWEEGKGMRDIGNLGGTCTTAQDLNNRGQVIGASNLAGDQAQHAFLWEDGSMRDLGGSLGGNFTGAFALNEQGNIVGFATLPQDATFHAVLWTGIGNLTDLGVLGNDQCSLGASINARMQVVGSSLATCNSDTGSVTAFLWEDGSIVDLNALIPSSSSLSLQFTQTINDRGEIAGTGADAAGDEHAFLLIPCDENHPGIEGCDYSVVDASALAAAPSVRAMPTAPHLNGANRRLLPELIRRLALSSGIHAAPRFHRVP